MVDLEELTDEDASFVRQLVGRHVELTGSSYGQHILNRWNGYRSRFVKVMPRDYKRVLAAEARARAESREPEFAELIGAAD